MDSKYFIHFWIKDFHTISTISAPLIQANKVEFDSGSKGFVPEH